MCVFFLCKKNDLIFLTWKSVIKMLHAGAKRRSAREN